MSDLAVAVATLTRIPVPRRLLRREDLAAAAVWFPVVGAGVGLVVGGVLVGGMTLVAPAVAAALAVAADVVLTGAFHLDGLADSADGLAGRDREHRLAIMKDHAVGVFGVTAIVLDLLVKTVTLATLATVPALVTSEWDLRLVLVGVVAACYAASRGAMVPLARALPYARSDGTGRAVIEGLTSVRTVAGTLLTLVLVIGAGLVADGAAGVSLDVAAVVVTLAVAVVTLVIGAVARRRLGGVTGDVLGATAELTLLAALVTAAALL